MTKLRVFFSRVWMALHRSQIDNDLDEEIRSHLEMEADEHQRKGIDAGESRQSALRNFGGVELVKERYRDGYRFQWIEDVVQDVRFALRTLRKSPGFTAVAVTTLAVGIGINTAVFTVTNAALFMGFPVVKENDRLLYISGNNLSYPELEDWRAQAKSFSSMAAMTGLFKFVSGSSDAPEIFSGVYVTANAFQVLGVNPQLGRSFSRSDGEPGASPVAVLSYELWERRFLSDPTVVGRTVELNGVRTVVVGVMPDGLSFPQRQDLWLPLVPVGDTLRRGVRFGSALGRLADGVTVQSARAEMAVIGRRLQSEYPKTSTGIPEVNTFNEEFIGPSATTLYKTMWGAVGFVLLIACANVANLLLGRAVGRSKELSVRAAIGAGRWRLIRQLLVESVLLSIVGGVLGWWIAKISVHLYVLTQRTDSFFTHALGYAMDYRVFAYFIAISIGTSFLFGVAPALRMSKLDVNNALKSGGPSLTSGREGKRLSAMLLAGEMALAVMLLAGAGVMIRSFLNIYKANMGARTENILAAFVLIPTDKYPNPDAQIAFYDALKSRLEAIPGVESVAFGIAPTERAGPQIPYELADALPVEASNFPVTSATSVSEDYFETLGATVMYGREFNEFDRASSQPVTIVNERFASRNWPGENPVGKRLRLIRNGQPQAWRTIVGVVSNIVQSDPTRQQFDPIIYVPLRERPSPGLSILARTRVPPETLSIAFQRQLLDMDVQIPYQHLVPLNAWISRVGGAYELNRNLAILFVVFGMTALLLASVGLYAVVAHSVSQRTQEIGIRSALGATARDIRRLVFRQGMLPLAAGLGMGLAGSFAVNRLLTAQLVRVSSSDPVTLASVSLVLVGSAMLGCAIPARRAVLVGSAMLGCAIPARRAMRVDPVIALRHE